MSSVQEQIIDLKRQAIALKEAGDVNGAMALLAQARDLEFDNANVEDIWEPLKLKQFAVVMKKRGDLDAARQALIKAKQIEKGELQQQEQVPPQEPVEEPKHDTTTTPQEPANEPARKTQPPKEPEQKNIVQQDIPVPENTPEPTPQIEPPVVDAPANDTTNQPAEDDSELKELLQLDQPDNNTQADVSYTIEEMMDRDMLLEFKQEGMPVPSDESYQTTILMCKKAALAAKKEGDTTKALKELQKAKKLEAVRLALSQVQTGSPSADDNDDWMAGLNSEESDLLGELFDKPATATLDATETSQNNNNNNQGSLEAALEELAGFLEDPALFMDAIEMGMEVPSVEAIEEKAEEQKMAAVAHKKAGDIEGAKLALVQSKTLTAHAVKLKAMLEQVERKKGGGTSPKNVNIDDLEAMLDAQENPTKKEPSKATPATTKPAEKTSDELKQEAIALRDQKKIKEAAEVLKLYKIALKREQDAQEMKRRKEIVGAIQKEIEYAQKQIRIFEYYERFVDNEAQQVAKWNEYATRCANVSKLIMAKGSDAVKVTKKKGEFFHARRTGDEQEQNDFNGLVADVVDRGGDPSDGRLEITIIGMENVNENTHLQKLLKKQKREHLPQHPSTVRIEVDLQIPPNEHDTESHIALRYEPPADALKKLELTTEEQKQNLPNSYPFDSSQYVDLERGNTAYGKIIRRRIERNKKATLTVFHVPVAEKKGWLWSKKNKEELPPPTLLGKVVVELQGLMHRKCVAAGDFPLMNGSGTKELGGSIRLAVRTGIPFGTPGEDGPGDDVELPKTVMERHQQRRVKARRRPMYWLETSSPSFLEYSYATREYNREDAGQISHIFQTTRQAEKGFSTFLFFSIFPVLRLVGTMGCWLIFMLRQEFFLKGIHINAKELQVVLDWVQLYLEENRSYSQVVWKRKHGDASYSDIPCCSVLRRDERCKKPRVKVFPTTIFQAAVVESENCFQVKAIKWRPSPTEETATKLRNDLTTGSSHRKRDARQRRPHRGKA
ncbi:expressed unknown protein [Seminavis robusta]|uniref:Uncharacterized protein n=1 Tax=Seminavis robusta TaxID=568900 RepID=A0A9N8DXY3_9STRA|nr:expressed unknown protein [Seminavis robusta]|eukprot:Sro440_g143390.1 n/a (1010) ;mRNA; r:15706-18812